VAALALEDRIDALVERVQLLTAAAEVAELSIDPATDMAIADVRNASSELAEAMTALDDPRSPLDAMAETLKGLDVSLERMEDTLTAAIRSDG